jgi:6-phosphogluconate dehydrogenase
MKIGLIGLGRMGSNLVFNALDNGQEIVVYNRSLEKAIDVVEKGAIAADSINDLIKKLPERKVIWLMVTAGKAVDTLIETILPFLNTNDILIDGGNSNYADSIERARLCAGKGVLFLDIGTSGGLAGARNGACMMAGGAREAYNFIEPFIKVVCVENGYGYVGKSGAGHFVKMVHNGIEYGMMQAIGEGFQLLQKSEFNLDLAEISKIYANGSVIRSWLIDLIQTQLELDMSLSKYSGKVGQGGEAQWAIDYAKKVSVDIPVINSSVEERIKSNSAPNFASQIVSALRFGFGSHKENS